MSFKKNYFSQVLFPLIFRVNKWTTKCLTKIYVEEKQLKEEIWRKHFYKNSCYPHTLQNGLKINLYNDSILSKLIYDGFEIEEIFFLKSVLQKGDVFIDVGANIGLFSLIASKCVGNEGQVISIEPTPKTFKRLVENIELNGINNISPLNIGLSNQKGSLLLQVSESGYDAWNTFAKAKESKFQAEINVKVDTLDDIIPEFSKGKIRLIKIDVEGWEKFVLEGGMNILINYNPILMIEFTEANTISAGYSVFDLFEILENIGYEWFRLDNGALIPEAKRISYPYDNLVAKKVYLNE
jgi:FkbM family methyltransferase